MLLFAIFRILVILYRRLRLLRGNHTHPSFLEHCKIRRTIEISLKCAISFCAFILHLVSPFIRILYPRKLETFSKDTRELFHNLFSSRNRYLEILRSENSSADTVCFVAKVNESDDDSGIEEHPDEVHIQSDAQDNTSFNESDNDIDDNIEYPETDEELTCPSAGTRQVHSDSSVEPNTQQKRKTEADEEESAMKRHRWAEELNRVENSSENIASDPKSENTGIASGSSAESSLPSLAQARRNRISLVQPTILFSTAASSSGNTPSAATHSAAGAFMRKRQISQPSVSSLTHSVAGIMAGWDRREGISQTSASSDPSMSSMEDRNAGWLRRRGTSRFPASNRPFTRSRGNRGYPGWVQTFLQARRNVILPAELSESPCGILEPTPQQQQSTNEPQTTLPNTYIPSEKHTSKNRETYLQGKNTNVIPFECKLFFDGNAGSDKSKQPSRSYSRHTAEDILASRTYNKDAGFAESDTNTSAQARRSASFTDEDSDLIRVHIDNSLSGITSSNRSVTDSSRNQSLDSGNNNRPSCDYPIGLSNSDFMLDVRQMKQIVPTDEKLSDQEIHDIQCAIESSLQDSFRSADSGSANESSGNAMAASSKEPRNVDEQDISGTQTHQSEKKSRVETQSEHDTPESLSRRSQEAKEKAVEGKSPPKFREYPGEAVGKVKKDARYQKRFYKQRKPVLLSADFGKQTSTEPSTTSDSGLTNDELQIVAGYPPNYSENYHAPSIVEGRENLSSENVGNASVPDIEPALPESSGSFISESNVLLPSKKSKTYPGITELAEIKRDSWNRRSCERNRIPLSPDGTVDKGSSIEPSPIKSKRGRQLFYEDLSDSPLSDCETPMPDSPASVLSEPKGSFRMAVSDISNETDPDDPNNDENRNLPSEPQIAARYVDSNEPQPENSPYDSKNEDGLPVLKKGQAIYRKRETRTSVPYREMTESCNPIKESKAHLSVKESSAAKTNSDSPEEINLITPDTPKSPRSENVLNTLKAAADALMSMKQKEISENRTSSPSEKESVQGPSKSLKEDLQEHTFVRVKYNYDQILDDKAIFCRDIMKRDITPPPDSKIPLMSPLRINYSVRVRSSECNMSPEEFLKKLFKVQEAYLVYHYNPPHPHMQTYYEDMTLLKIPMKSYTSGDCDDDVIMQIPSSSGSNPGQSPSGNNPGEPFVFEFPKHHHCQMLNKNAAGKTNSQSGLPNDPGI